MRVGLFDLDGTLIDSSDDLVLAINLTRADFNLPRMGASEVMGCVGDGVRKLVERTMPECPELWDEMLKRQRQHYLEHCLDNTRAYPGVIEGLQRLKARGWSLAVVTNKPKILTMPILEGLGMLPLFGAVVGGGDCPTLKPAAAMLHTAAAWMGRELTAEDWMVGDHYTDLQAARLARIKRCFCRYGFGETRGEEYDIVVDEMAEFVATVCADS